MAQQYTPAFAHRSITASSGSPSTTVTRAGSCPARRTSAPARACLLRGTGRWSGPGTTGTTRRRIPRHGGARRRRGFRPGPADAGPGRAAAHHGRETGKAATESRLRLSPQLLHREHLLAHDLPAQGRVDAVIAEQQVIPARGDAEKEPAPGDLVERGGLFREQDRIVEGRVQAPVPRLSRCVTAAAAPSATNGSGMPARSAGVRMSSSPGFSSRSQRLTVRWVYCTWNSDPRLASSAGRASSATPTCPGAANASMPTCIPQRYDRPVPFPACHVRRGAHRSGRRGQTGPACWLA